MDCERFLEKMTCVYQYLLYNRDKLTAYECTEVPNSCWGNGRGWGVGWGGRGAEDSGTFFQRVGSGAFICTQVIPGLRDSGILSVLVIQLFMSPVGTASLAEWQGVRLESGRSRVRIPLTPGFFRGRVIPVT